MIIGNGMLARAFQEFEEDENTIVFASGVSNSLETDEAEFDRERLLLEDTRKRNPAALIVYFSTCSIADPHRSATPYVQHKLYMERFLAEAPGPWLVLRLPVVIGHSSAARTFPFFVRDSILEGRSFEVWEKATRYPLDVSDLVRLSRCLIEDSVYWGRVIDLALRGYKAMDIVRAVEALLGVSAKTTPVQDAGSDFDLDLSLARGLADKLGISFDETYLDRVLARYFGHSQGLPAIKGGQALRTQENAIVFGIPELGEAEIAAVSDVIRSGWIGKGPRVKAFEEQFAEYKGAPYAVACSSGTSALHLALLATGIRPGDEVLVPTMTFCATVQAVELVGAKPILVDCEPRSFNIDPKLIESAISPRTRAIIPVHIAGRCARMKEIMDIARRHSLIVIEDCAHAVESVHHGIPAGLIGDAGCFSFYATKSITTADGGMLLVRDKELERDARLRSLHGMDSDAWLRRSKKLDYSRVQEFGFKYNLTDMEAALGIVQLKSVHDRWSRRREHWNRLSEGLSHLPLTLPLPEGSEETLGYHLYQVVLQSNSIRCGRDQFVRGLRAEGIGVGVHYVPVHVQPYYQRTYGFCSDDFPVASEIGQNTLSLPLNPQMTSSDVNDICNAVERLLDYHAP